MRLFPIRFMNAGRLNSGDDVTARKKNEDTLDSTCVARGLPYIGSRATIHFCSE
jgi:hypothetical protein